MHDKGKIFFYTENYFFFIFYLLNYLGLGKTVKVKISNKIFL